MAKKFVIKEATTQRIRFLRGMPVQSPVAAGLSLQDACAVVRVLRRELQNTEQITGAERRTRALACSNL